MDPVSSSIVISAPREAVFDYLQDIANHATFTDHYLVDWHLTRVESSGRGAGARFRLKAPGPGSRFGWGDVVLAEVERPHRIVEHGRGGKSNRVRTLGVYELQDAGGGSTRVSFTFESAPATLPDRLVEMLGARRWIARNNMRALRRLRAILETPAGADAPRERGRRVTVAGG